MNEDNFKELLKKHITNVEFLKIAKLIFFKTLLQINQKDYQIIEFEIYIHNPTHQDYFVHRHPLQKNMATWYFHQITHKEHSYKGGTFKGLDITCGQDTQYGGILLRSIYDKQNYKIIEGPCNIVNHILNINKATSVKNFVLNDFDNNLDIFHNPKLRLIFSDNRKTNIFTSTRIGLNLKNPNIDLKKNHINKLYRFIIYPTKIKKDKKNVILNALKNNVDEEIILSCFLLSKYNLNKYKLLLP